MPKPSRGALSHLDEAGAARMVYVGSKQVGRREAVATAVVHVGKAALELIASSKLPKGDAFAAARIAGILAAKRTSEVIPLCHMLALESVEVQIHPEPPERVFIVATVSAEGKTGVEMEALTAASVAALTLYDMCKSVNRAIEIGPVRLESKTGGKSGTYQRFGRQQP